MADEQAVKKANGVMLYTVFTATRGTDEVVYAFVPKHQVPAIPDATLVGRIFAYENGDYLSFEPEKGLPKSLVEGVERHMTKIERLPGRPKPKIIPWAMAAKNGEFHVDFEMNTPAAEQDREKMRNFLVPNALKGGAVKAAWIEGETKWLFRAEFAEAQVAHEFLEWLSKQFAKAGAKLPIAIYERPEVH